MKFAPKRGWTLNGLRFVSPGVHGETEFFHVNDFPVYAAAPEMLCALRGAEATLSMCSGKLPDYAEVRRKETLDMVRAAIVVATT